MMKKISFMFAVAGMLFAACSAEKDVAAEENNEFRSEGYMVLNINLPTTLPMKAANDRFADGTSNEYKVSDCALLIFQGNDEESATLLNAQPILFNSGELDADNDNITVSYPAVAKVTERKQNGGDLYVLAVLNYRNLMSIDNEGMPIIAGTTLTKASTLNDIRQLETSADLTTRGSEPNNYFFMTNAVLSEAQGGEVTTAPVSGKIFQLAKVTKIHASEAEAKAQGAAAVDILVERAVAKATLRVSATQIELSENKKLAIDAAQTEWTIDNMEPSTYVARNPGDDLSYIGYRSNVCDDYRFVGSATTKLHDGKGSTTDAYRTYWCVDPQYENVSAPQMKGATSYSSVGDNNPLYCYENTFDVDGQNYKNTTRGIIKVVLEGAQKENRFWTVNGSSDQLLNVNDAKSYIADFLISNATVMDTFKEALTTGKDWVIRAEDFDIEFEDERNETNGQLKVKSLDLSQNVKNNCGADMTFAADFAETFAAACNTEDFIAVVNKGVIVREYQGGVMYYEARFKHFAGLNGTDLAPWNDGEYEEGKAPSGGSTANAYPGEDPTRSANYLGRYGMVRNNWYDVNVTAIKKLGYPVDPSGQINNPDFDKPDTPDTPDDNFEEYIKIQVQVLSWAKREQSWSF